MATPTRILLVDDHCIMREGLALLLARADGFEVVGQAGTSEEAVAGAAALNPDVVVMDVHLGGVSGIETCRRILARLPGVRVVFLSSDGSPDLVGRALQAGGTGYVLKDEAGQELVGAIHTVLKGRVHLNADLTAALIRAQGLAQFPGRACDLAERDMTLIRLIADGLRNKEIAVRMELGIKSVEAMRSRLMTRLGVSSPAELVRLAIREGIVKA